jgi:phage-related protein
MDDVKGREPLLSVRFFRTAGGQEPVREWLLELGEHDRRTVGRDIKTAQLGWPVGMPLIRKLEPGLWEVRSNIVPGTARVIFTVEGRTMVLLHAFTKKSRKTSAGDLTMVRRRLRELRADECEEESDESKTCRHRL